MQIKNWEKIVSEVLTHNNISEYRLCKMMGVSTGYFTTMRAKKSEPSYSKGEFIIKLHPNYKELLNA